VTSLGSCVSTARLAPEYDQQYYLAEDVKKYSATSYTGLFSVWFTGPQRVETIASATIPDTGGTLLKKGCPVRIMQINHVTGIDASSTEAKLQISDSTSKSTFVVYVKWPGVRSLLTTDAPMSP
ncbi:MAG: hypothetical protein ABMA15_26395, partial [Vicinamibacterales bacterium]